MTTRPSRRLLLLGTVVVLLVATPVVITIAQAVTTDWTSAFTTLSDARIPSLLLNATLVALLVTPICGALGVAAAWFVERTNVPFRAAWSVLLILPLTIPLFVTSYAWSGLGEQFRGLFGAVSIVSVSYYPIVYLLASVALRGMDPALEESARALGLGTWKVFWRVVMPQLRPALLGGLLVIALDALVEFDAFVGIHFSVFAGSIYGQYRVSFSTSGAAVLACISTLTCVAVLVIEARLRGNKNYVSVRQGAQRQAVRYSLGKTFPLVVLGLFGLLVIAVGIPVALTLSWFGQPSLGTAAGLIGTRLLPATLTSVALGLSAAACAVILAMPIAVLATRFRGKGVTWIERASYLSFALPDLVAAIALSYLASQFLGFLYGTIPLLVFAYAILFCPIAVLALRVSFGQIDPSFDQVARSLGAGPIKSFFRVGLPIARPGIAGALVLVFAFVLSDLSTTQVLAPPGMVTLGTEFWANASTVALGAAAPYAATTMILAAVAAQLLMTRFGKTRLSGA